MIAELDYKPHANARKLHRSQAREVLIVAPIRSGKTYSLRYDIITTAWNNPNKKHTTLVTAPEYKQLEPLLEKPLAELLKEQRLLKWHNQSKHLIMLKNGRTITCRALENYEAIRGLDVFAAYVDEVTLARREAIDVVKGRLLTTNGQLKMAGTPKGTNNWVYDQYFGPDAIRPAHLEIIHYSIFDNPTITAEAVERIKADYDPLMVRQEIYAEWVNLWNRRVYYAFDEATNVKPFTFNHHEPVFIGLDYNIGINAWVAMQRDARRNWSFVFDEGTGARTTQELAAQIKSKFGTEVYIIDDATGSNRQQGDGKTQRQILAQCGLHKTTTNRSNPERVQRYANTNAHFENGVGNRHLFIDSKCKRLISELNNLVYYADSDVPDDRGGKMGHITDALGYVTYYLSGGRAAWDVTLPITRAA